LTCGGLLAKQIRFHLLEVNSMIRVLAVHTRSGVRTGVINSLSATPEFDVVGWATSIAGASRVCAALRPEVVTVDARLPDGDGLALIDALGGIVPELKAVMLGPSDRDLVRQAVAAGVSSYLVDGFCREDVVTAVRHAALATPSFSAMGVAVLRGQGRRCRSSEPSSREREVLRLLTQGCGVTAIARRLDVSESTVKTYIGRLRTKLRVDTRSELRELASSGHGG
jgi:DNA-binding NarL/FixJ family response regulator